MDISAHSHFNAGKTKTSWKPTLRSLLMHPLAKKLDIDSNNAMLIHREILDKKPLLRAVYEDWYRECSRGFQDTEGLSGDIIEIGSGAGFIEKFIPKIIKTDVVPTPFTARVVDATRLDYGEQELKGICMIGVLHHIHEPAQFFHEATRCLKVGGRVVMIEPNNSRFEKILCKLLDHYEYVDDTIKEWQNESDNRMSRANLALPWVIFVRDRARYEREFPLLRIKEIRYHTFLAYVVTGGMSFRQFLPSFALPLVRLIERCASPWMRKLGTSMTIVLEKQAHS